MPRHRQILYALGSLGANALIQSYTLWLVFFYAPPLETGRPTLVPIVTLGILHGASKLLESFIDPLIGFLSDRTRSPLGRRSPYILFGTPFLALAFTLLWTPPDSEATLLNGAYLFAILLLFHLGFTVVMAPYDALLPEVAPTSRARVNLASLKVVTGVAGAAIGLTASGPLIERLGFPAMGAGIGAVALAAYFLAVLGFHPHALEAVPASLSLGASAKATLNNRPFLVLVACLAPLFLARDLLTQALPYFATLILGVSEANISLLSGALIAVTVLTLPALSWAAARYGKKPAASLPILFLGLYIPTLSLIGLVPLEVPLLTQATLAVALMGVPVAALSVFPYALLADVVDYDALRTGQRREAFYFGTLATLTKLAPAASAVVLALLLQLFGFSRENPLGVRLVPAVAGAFALVGWAIFQRGYHLTESRGKSAE